MLYIILALSFIARLFYVLAPNAPWWDSAVYIGMGKSIFTNGEIGMWEPFRPVVWPTILGFFWKIGLDPHAMGLVLELAASLAAVYYAYKLAERIKPGSGIFSAALTAFTPVIVAFTNLPLTDIPSMALGLAAAYYLSIKRPLVSGIVISFAFIFRFPLALIAIVLTAAIFLLPKQEQLKTFGRFMLGSIPILILFFALNTYLYSDPLYPIKAGSTVAANSVGPYDGLLYFYIAGLLAQNPFLILSLIPIYFWIRKPKELLKSIPAFVATGCAIVLGMYFSLFPHKEIRYAIAFAPYWAILAGVGITMVLNKISLKHIHKFAAFGISAVLIILTIVLLGKYYPTNATAPERQAYFDYFKNVPKTRVITSSPHITIYSDAKLVSISDMWEDLESSYRAFKDQAEYVALDTCELYCYTDRCDASRNALTAELQDSYPLVFSKTAQTYRTCDLKIYKITR